MLTPDAFRCDSRMVKETVRIFDGEYAVPGAPSLDKPRVLDLGAHVGAFVLWAADQWPGCQVFAVEPNEDTFRKLSSNLGAACVAVTPEEASWDLPGGGKCHAVRAAVVDRDKQYVFLRHGANNPGEASLYDLGQQQRQGESVRCLQPSMLPPCDVMKIDTEGCELEILRAYQWLGGVRVLALEWHRKTEIPALISVCHEAGLRLAGANTDGRVLKFARAAE